MTINQGIRPNVFNYSHYRTFLNDYCTQLKGRDSKYSFRYLTKRLRLKSPATFNMILRGHRHPSSELVSKIGEWLDFTSSEFEYFRTLVDIDKSSAPNYQKNVLLQKSQYLNPKHNTQFIPADVFSLISNWYYFAILQLIDLPQFKSDPKWIQSQFIWQVSLHDISNALQVLSRLGLIKKAKGRWVKTLVDITTETDIPNEAIKQYHEQLLALAKSSLRFVDVQNRYISGTTFNIRIEDLPKMKKELESFQNRFYRKFEKSNADSTYQIQFQLFPLTQTKKGKAK